MLLTSQLNEDQIARLQKASARISKDGGFASHDVDQEDYETSLHRLSLYFAKGYQCEVPEGFKNVGRFWGCSRGLLPNGGKPLVQLRVFSEDPFVDVEKLLSNYHGCDEGHSRLLFFTRGCKRGSEDKLMYANPFIRPHKKHQSRLSIVLNDRNKEISPLLLRFFYNHKEVDPQGHSFLRRLFYRKVLERELPGSSVSPRLWESTDVALNKEQLGS